MKRKNLWKLVSLLPLTWGISLAACTNNVAMNQNSSSENHTNPSQPTINDSNHDGNNETNDQADEINSPPTKPQLSETTFSELKLKSSITITDPEYTKLLPQAAWNKLANNLNLVASWFKQVNPLDQQYQLKIQQDLMTFPDQAGGVIKHLIAFIQKNNQFQLFRFDLVGLQKQVLTEAVKQERSEFLVKNKNINQKLFALYPSFLANVLYYADNIPNRHMSDEATLKLDYFNFLNGNDDFLNIGHLSLNQAVLTQLFMQKKTGHYLIKVVGIKFNDLKGTMGLNIRISNEDASSYNNPAYEEQFEFSGFRQLDLNHVAQNVLSLSLPEQQLSTLLQEYRPIQQLINQHQHDQSAVDLIQELTKTKGGSNKVNQFKVRLFKTLSAIITDNLHHIYQNNYGDLKLSSIAVINGNYGIYPFYSYYSPQSMFEQLALKMSNESNMKKLTLSINVELPIFVIDNYTTIDELYSSANQKITLPLSVSIPFNSAIKLAH